MKEKNNKMFNFEGNRECPIDVTVNFGKTDKLSYEEIYKNNNINSLENEFSNRIGFSCNILSLQLPDELKSFFEIRPRIVDDKLEYYTKPKSKEAYEKYPFQMKINMKFKSKEEAKKFRKNGIIELQEKANVLNKAIQIENITEIKELLGNFEDPTSDINRNGSENIKLYILPQKDVRKNENYSIELFNDEYTFKIENTKLKIKEQDENKCIMNNLDSKEELFDIYIEQYKDLSQQRNGRIKISIFLRDSVKYDCYYNLELFKFIFIINDKRCNIIIKNKDNEEKELYINNCGKDEYTEEDYKMFERLNILMNNAIYIQKIKNIKWQYDCNYFWRHEDEINILANYLKHKEYKLNNSIMWSYNIEDNDEVNKKIEIELEKIELFGTKFKINNCFLLLDNCEIIEEDNINNKRSIKSNNIVLKYEQ